MAQGTLVVRGGRIVTPEGVVEGDLLLRDGKVAGAGPAGTWREGPFLDAGGGWVLPGFVDLHVHGALGRDFADGSRESAEAVVRFHASHGTTTMLATVAAADPDATCQALSVVASLARSQPWGAYIGGIHLEGPFINPVRKGAFDPDSIQPPTVAMARRFVEAAQGYLRMVTLAPELPGSDALVDVFRAAGVVVSAGHTDATYAQAVAAFQRGVRHVTHCFNGMRPFHHREPGIIGAALLDADVTCEVIPDGVHVSLPALRLLYRMKGLTGMAAVTDASAFCGVPDGAYTTPRGRELVVSTGRVMLADGSSLAGSALTMDAALRNLTRFLGLSPVEASSLVSASPARIVGLQGKGAIRPGNDADLVVLDAELRLVATVCRGEVVWRGGA